MPTDYYECLGLPRTASAEDVRRAYRRLAKQHHPDVSGGDPEADGRFKDINEAYEVLKDPQKRAAYDRYGSAGVRGASRGGPVPGDFSDLGDIFEQFFGFGTRGRSGPATRSERGSDLRASVRLGFEEAAFGVTRTVHPVRRETCDGCGGSGAQRGTAPESCPTCQGTGEVRRVSQSFLGSLVNVHPCRDCGGTGQVVRSPCSVCHGAGRTQRARTLEVDVPSGVADGMQIRLSGEGDHGRFGGPPGDLYVDVSVDAHEHFQRDGDDILLELRVNAADAALGSEVTVPTLDGSTTVRMPAGTQTGDTVRLSGAGVPHLRRTGRGDQVITIFVATPPRLTRQQRELFEKLRSTLPQPEVVAQQRTGFWDRVRERFS
jgi:molecular chaperone DnaJ